MNYVHRNQKGERLNFPLGKVVCIGRNYAAHAKELGHEVPTDPLFFMKPKAALVELEKEFSIPRNKGEVHFETEIAVLLSKDLKNATCKQVKEAVWGYGIAFDLTLRDLQKQLKEKGQPWEKAKAFDGACPVSRFISKEKFIGAEIYLESFNNNKRVQFADTELMLWTINELISLMSESFTLEAGDIILTGTPEGVAVLHSGDELGFNLMNAGKESVLRFTSRVC